LFNKKLIIFRDKFEYLISVHRRDAAEIRGEKGRKDLLFLSAKPQRSLRLCGEQGLVPEMELK